ncbi:MAG: hypothetical protein ONB23_08445 [candidate division KSB1 bacterium]|nr:hypothetical protein [candidate division KSB1 bacterium]
MLRASSWVEGQSGPIRVDWMLMCFLIANLVFNVAANVSFKLSALGPDWRAFLKWQVVGNLCGFATVLSFTAMLRSLPLSVAYPVTTGLAVIGVQLVAAGLVFQEAIPARRWYGSVLVIMGILMIGG